MTKIFWGLIFSVLVNFQAFGQSFNATVNRNVLPEGETLVLTLDLQDADTQATPDLSGLSKDFTVLSVSNGYRTSIINGNVSKSRQWNLVLIPNTGGSLTIPVISLDNFQTQPINLKVIPAGSEDALVQNKTSAAPQFKISGEADNLTPYVQQQIKYRLKIYDTGGLQGEAPVFAAASDEWVIKNLGQPKVETKIVNGKTLREITFEYALFPQKSGALTIPPARFNGYYLTKSSRTDPFARFFNDDDFFGGFAMNDVFANKTPVILSTKPIAVNVRPAPAGSGWWLPASDVKLSAGFEKEKPQFKVGEAVSRTIYLKAAGVLDTQLPEIKFASVNGVKQYPEKPVTEMMVENGQIVSYAKIANVYIPSENGEIILPAIKIKWFNTASGKFEIASIPEYKAMVSGMNEAKQIIVDISKPEEPAPVASPVVVETAANEMVIWLLLSAFVGGIILTLVLLKLFSRVTQKSGTSKKMVIAAAKAKDLRRLRDELIAWAATEFPRHKIINLQDVADVLEQPAFNRELDLLRETLYADNEKSWDDKTFLAVFAKISKNIKKHKRTIHEPLPKLYK